MAVSSLLEAETLSTTSTSIKKGLTTRNSTTHSFLEKQMIQQKTIYIHLFGSTPMVTSSCSPTTVPSFLTRKQIESSESSLSSLVVLVTTLAPPPRHFSPSASTSKTLPSSLLMSSSVVVQDKTHSTVLKPRRSTNRP